MTKYLISRLLLVFFLKFFTGWAFNIDGQLLQFFGVDIGESVINKILSWLLTILVIAFGLMTINLVYTFFNLTDNLSFQEMIQSIGRKGLKNSVKKFFQNFSGLVSENFQNEVRRERYPGLFFLFVIFFLPFISGNPLLNNYYGIYKEYEVESQSRDGGTNYIESKNYIIHKSNEHEINNRMNRLEENYDEDKPYYEVKKRGYLFIQAGLIDGFKTYYDEYKGFSAYIECIFFSALEKLLNAIIYFLLPLIIAISIYTYRTKDDVEPKKSKYGNK